MTYDFETRMEKNNSQLESSVIAEDLYAIISLNLLFMHYLKKKNKIEIHQNHL